MKKFKSFIIILYVISAAANLWFGIKGIREALKYLTDQHSIGMGTTTGNLMMAGIPCLAGLLYIALLFKPKNQYGNISVILNTALIAVVAMLVFVGSKAGEGGIGILFLLFALIPVGASIAVFFAVRALKVSFKYGLWYGVAAVLIFFIAAFYLGGISNSYEQQDKEMLVLAQQTKDPRYCADIHRLYDRYNNCYEHLARYSTNGIEICKQIAVNSDVTLYWSKSCYRTLPATPESCPQFPQYAQEDCFKRIRTDIKY